MCISSHRTSCGLNTRTNILLDAEVENEEKSEDPGEVQRHTRTLLSRTYPVVVRQPHHVTSFPMAFFSASEAVVHEPPWQAESTRCCPLRRQVPVAMNPSTFEGTCGRRRHHESDCPQFFIGAPSTGTCGRRRHHWTQYPRPLKRIRELRLIRDTSRLKVRTCPRQPNLLRHSGYALQMPTDPAACNDQLSTVPQKHVSEQPKSAGERHCPVFQHHASNSPRHPSEKCSPTQLRLCLSRSPSKGVGVSVFFCVQLSFFHDTRTKTNPSNPHNFISLLECMTKPAAVWVLHPRATVVHS